MWKHLEIYDIIKFNNSFHTIIIGMVCDIMPKNEKLVELYSKCIENNYTDLSDEAQQLKVKVFAMDLGLKYKKIEDLFIEAETAYEEHRLVLEKQAEELKEKEDAKKKQKEKEQNAKHAIKIKGIKHNSFVDVFVCEDGSVFCCEGSESSRVPSVKSKKYSSMGFTVESSSEKTYTYHPSKTIFTGALAGGIAMGGTHQTKAYYSAHEKSNDKGVVLFRYGDIKIGVEYAAIKSDFPDLLKRLPGYKDNFKRNKAMCRNDVDNSLDLKVALNAPDMATKMSIVSIADEKTKIPFDNCVEIANILNRIVHNNLPEPDEEVYKKAIELSQNETVDSLAEAIERFKYLSDYKDSKDRLAQIKPTYEELLQSEKEQEVLRLEAKKAKRLKNKKIVAIVVAILIICGIVLSFVIKSINLNKAYELEATEDYYNAMCLYTQLGDYKDARPRAAELIKKNNLKSIAAGRGFSVAVKTDGTVVATGNNEHGQCNISEWKNVISIDAGFEHTVALKSDGTVVATGNNEKGQCDVENWSDIIAIAAGGDKTIGLTTDGKILITSGEDEVEALKNIIAIDAGHDGYVALTADGTVVATATKMNRVEYEFPNGVKDVAMGFNHYALLKDNGTIFATGYDNNYGKCDVSEWTDVIDIFCGEDNTFGLKADGSVVFTGSKLNSYDLGVLKDVVYISEAPGLIIALKEDGTVVATGSNRNGECNVSNWKNIVVYN